MAENKPSDADLARSAQTGSESAFAELVRLHKGRVFAILGRFARSEADLDDLAQDVFVRVWQKIGTYREDAPFEHWLARITTRTAYDYLRRERPPALALDDCTIAAPEQDPAQAREQIMWALDQLLPKERLVITLLELEEYSVREVAAMTGWTESNVKVRAFRSRQQLKRLLEKARKAR